MKPALEEHFRVSLKRYHGPDFLSYGEAAFYRHQCDTSPGAPAEILRRLVSVVIFFQQESAQPSERCYGRGVLTFYDLLDGAEGKKCAFALDAEPGLLVAFRSDTVQPVTHARRFIVVAWFVTDATANPSGPP